MTFLSGKFLFFVIAAVVFYFLVPLKHRWIVLLVSSMIFYASSGIRMVPFLLVTTAVVYGAARWIDSVYEKRLAYIKEQGPDRAEKKRLQQLDKKKCRRILAGAFVIVIGILVYCKAGSRLLSALSHVFE